MKTKILPMSEILEIIKTTNERMLKNLKDSQEIIKRIKAIRNNSGNSLDNAKVHSDKMINELDKIPKIDFDSMKKSIHEIKDFMKESKVKCDYIQKIISAH